MDKRATDARPDGADRTATPAHPSRAGRTLRRVERTGLVVALGFLANMLFLGIDIRMPQQYAIAILYAAPIMVAFWLPSPRATLILALAGSVCSLIGYTLTPVAPPVGPVETALYRIIAIALIWVAAFLAVRHQIARAHSAESAVASRHQIALLQAILDTSPDALVVIDVHGTIQSFGRAAERLFGYSAGEAIGRNVSILMPHGDREAHDGYLARYLRTGERRIIGIGRVVEGETKDGRKFPVELSVGEARVESHRVFIGFLRDLSARVRIEEELRQAQKMEAIGQLTGGIAHDFNNLLLVIGGNLELIETRPDRPDPVALRDAREAIELGTQLTARLLAFGRKQTLDPKEVDIAELAGGVVSMLRRTLGDDIEVALDIPESPGKAVVDAAQLQTALINLAINARDALERGGRIVITVRDTEIDAAYAQNHPEVRLGRYVVVEVADNGAGMNEEVRARAVEPFFTTKPYGAGNGLGLSMVYGFVKQSNGHFEIESAVGQGTTVTLYLPHAEGRRAGAAQPAATGADRGAGETILVVEDDRRVRRIALARLRELGYRTVEASNGEEALDVLRSPAAVDLLFTDIVLGSGMSGFELARQARAEMPALRILYTTGYASPDVVERAGGVHPPASHMLRKPYTKERLARTVRMMLDAPS
ncbi:PAS domain S-box protein [Acuticoccus kandeliae]|uniref:PAS domain S-box protein n=1 Tax=Acuticoccus kandeliae TaxID=2073160 RepID=UPI00196B0FFC|nr:PAS domain S-box protein [Acuticoccus kandeliae]